MILNQRPNRKKKKPTKTYLVDPINRKKFEALTFTEMLEAAPYQMQLALAQLDKLEKEEEAKRNQPIFPPIKIQIPDYKKFLPKKKEISLTKFKGTYETKKNLR